MLQYHTSMSLIHLSSLKLSSKTAALNTNSISSLTNSSPSETASINIIPVSTDDSETISQPSNPDLIEMLDLKAATTLVDSESAQVYAGVIAYLRPQFNLKPWSPHVEMLDESWEKVRNSALGDARNLFDKIIRKTELSLQLNKYEISSSTVSMFYLIDPLVCTIIAGEKNVFIFDPGGHDLKHNKASLSSQGMNQVEDTVEIHLVSMADRICLRLAAKPVGNEVTSFVMPFLESNIPKPKWRNREAATFTFGSVLEGPSVITLSSFVHAVSAFLDHICHNALSYFDMVYSWDGYTFIINLIPMHLLLCIGIGHYSSRLYIAYAPLVVLGTLLAALVPVVGFNAVMTSEHFASFLVFIIIHVVALVCYVRGILSPKMVKVAMTLVLTLGITICFAVLAILVALVASSPTKGWSGRSLSLLDPPYASKYIPIIASVSEHQPPTWPSYFMDLNVLASLVPAVCIISGIALSEAFSVFTGSTAVAILLLVILGGFYVVHSVWAAAEAYSAPSIVLTFHSHDGLHVFDDFREAYSWLSHNTDVDDKVASWWDCVYQATTLANRTVIDDDNTWSNSYINYVYNLEDKVDLEGMVMIRITQGPRGPELYLQDTELRKIIRAPTGVMHGKESIVYYEEDNNNSLLDGLPNPFVAGRYHSLVIENESFASDLEITLGQRWINNGCST